MKSLLKKKGFTLVEVLIVVVIIGILASLILPRLLQQPERARIAEANQFLGVLRRAQLNRLDSTGAAAYVAIAGNVDANFAQLGMQTPGLADADGPFFTYTCVAGGITDVTTTAGDPATCTALRAVDIGPAGGDQITVNINSGAFGCTSAYTVAVQGPGCVAS